MDSYLEQFKNVLFHDFKQSWIFVSILFVAGTTILRWLLTSRIKKSSKRISSKNLKPIQSQYLYKSISGWFFYCLSGGLFVFAWYAWFYQIYGLQSVACHFAVASGALFLLSIITHLTFFCSACLDQIKLIEDKQLTP
jgi:hypothetical protein